MKRMGLLVLCAITLLAPTLVQANDDYPLRDKYPEVKWIDTDELYDALGDAIVVDARNAMEYNVIHIAGSRNYLVGKMKKGDLLQLRALSSETPLVFYCNGHNCSKSYKAAEKARFWGFDNIYAYDAGIFEWSEAYPEQVEFFDEVLSAAELKTKLIGKSDFAAACLEPEQFMAKVNQGSYRLFDVRDRKERGENPMRLTGTTKLTVDEMVGFLAKPGALPSSGLLVFDNVGKQVRWMQYYFEKHGITDYHFLKGGVAHWQEAGWNPEGTREASGS